jgi:hypothetical protein
MFDLVNALGESAGEELVPPPVNTNVPLVKSTGLATGIHPLKIEGAVVDGAAEAAATAVSGFIVTRNRVFAAYDALGCVLIWYPPDCHAVYVSM